MGDKRIFPFYVGLKGQAVMIKDHHQGEMSPTRTDTLCKLLTILVVASSGGKIPFFFLHDRLN
jgi:hypothetical protein